MSTRGAKGPPYPDSSLSKGSPYPSVHESLNHGYNKGRVRGSPSLRGQRVDISKGTHLPGDLCGLHWPSGDNTGHTGASAIRYPVYPTGPNSPVAARSSPGPHVSPRSGHNSHRVRAPIVSRCELVGNPTPELTRGRTARQSGGSSRTSPAPVPPTAASTGPANTNHESVAGLVLCGRDPRHPSVGNLVVGVAHGVEPQARGARLFEGCSPPLPSQVRGCSIRRVDPSCSQQIDRHSVSRRVRAG